MNSSSNYSQVYSVEDLMLYAAAGNLIVSLPINTYILWLILTGTRKRMASDFFSFNLAASDILTCFCSCVVLVNLYIHISVVDTLLTLTWFALDLNRAMMLCCVCAELYLAVVHPVVYMKYKPLRYKLACAGLVWLTVSGLCVVRAFASAHVLYNIYIAECLLILLVTSFFSLAVLRALRKTAFSGTQKTRAYKYILIIMLSITITYSIWFSVIVAFYGHWDALMFYVAQIVSFMINSIVVLVQPFLYLHKAQKLPCCKLL